MLYLKDPLVVAQFYPSIFNMMVKGHVVFMTMSDEYESTKAYDEAVHITQTYASILEEVQARTALAREGVMVECPFQAGCCVGGAQCVHCVDSPSDLALEYLERDSNDLDGYQGVPVR